MADANNNGGYVDAGPVTYQLQISRVLNPYSTEDSPVRQGPAQSGDRRRRPTSSWYGVFLWAKNQTHHAQTTTDNFDVTDTQGNKYYPIKLDPNANPYAWTSQTPGAPADRARARARTASFGPTQGGLLLFKISNIGLQQPAADARDPRARATSRWRRSRSTCDRPARGRPVLLASCVISWRRRSSVGVASAAGAPGAGRSSSRRPDAGPAGAPSSPFASDRRRGRRVLDHRRRHAGQRPGLLVTRIGRRCGRPAAAVDRRPEVLDLAYAGRRPGAADRHRAAAGRLLQRRGRRSPPAPRAPPAEPQTLVGGPRPAPPRQLVVAHRRPMLAAVATERGVWAAESVVGEPLCRPHRLTGARQAPQSMAAAAGRPERDRRLDGRDGPGGTPTRGRSSTRSASRAGRPARRSTLLRRARRSPHRRAGGRPRAARRHGRLGRELV